MTRWEDLPDRVELFDDMHPDGIRRFIVGRVANGVVQLLDYYGCDYDEAILIAEAIANERGIEVYDRVAHSTNTHGGAS